MLTDEQLDTIERACTGPDAAEAFTGVVNERVVLELVREVKALRRKLGQPSRAER
jgi:hypothetical protein